MSDLAVTGDYFEEPIDDRFINGPDIRKTPKVNTTSESGVLNHDVAECIIGNQ